MLPIEFISGVVLALVAVATGLTFSWHSRRSQARLLRANAELSARARMLQEYSSQPIVLLDRGGLIRSVNRAAERLSGYEERELHGQSILRLLPYVEPMSVTLGEGIFEIEISRKDQSRRRAWCYAGTVGSSHSASAYLFFVEPANGASLPGGGSSALLLTAMSALAGRVANQFESLMTIINGYSELALVEAGSTGPARSNLEEVAAASNQACRLVRHLLVSSGNQLVPVEATDLSRLVEDMRAEICGSLAYSIDIDPGSSGPKILTNPECLREVVRMLCDSAQARMRGSDRLTIRVESCQLALPRVVYSGTVPTGNYGVLAISDCARPLAPETQAHLFEPLYESGGAAEIDLSSVYGIVKSLGGSIDVKSEAGSGTRFEILLPCA